METGATVRDERGIASGELWREQLGSVAPRDVSGYRNIAIAYASLVILWLVAIQFSYVADLRLERHVFSRSTDPNVIVSVELGGAVSSPSPLRMSVTGSTASGKLSAPLRLTRVGSGRYVSVLPTRSLPIGDYEISMTYPHGAISPAFPFSEAASTEVRDLF
jgi:hypothetical protein